MIKYFLLLFVLLFLQPPEKGFGQTEVDSSGTDIGTDSLQGSPGDTVETMDINPYSLYRLKAHSGRRLNDSVREVNGKQFKSYLLNPDYAYANDPDYWRKTKPGKPGLLSNIIGSRVFRWIVYGFLIGLVVFGVYLLAKENNFTWLSRVEKLHSPGSVPQDIITETDFGAAVQKYQTQGNYRMAVRYMYLSLLQEVAEKSGIRFGDSSTNAQIALAFGNHPAAGDFRFLSRAYEYIFYGGFSPSEELYLSLRNKFDDFKNSFSV